MRGINMVYTGILHNQENTYILFDGARNDILDEMQHYLFQVVKMTITRAGKVLYEETGKLTRQLSYEDKKFHYCIGGDREYEKVLADNVDGRISFEVVKVDKKRGNTIA
jgi:hypothetical protein